MAGDLLLKSISDFSPWSADYELLLFSTFRYIVSKSVLSVLEKIGKINP